MPVRPDVRFLTDELIERILAEARDILCQLGVTVHNQEVLSLLADQGARVDAAKSHVRLTQDMIDSALKTVPASFRLYDVTGRQTHEFAGSNVYFTPASSCLNVLDRKSGKNRKPTSADYIAYVKVVNGLAHIASQSTAFVPADVHEKISDSYRLYLSLLCGEKPVFTGTFSDNAFQVMKAMLAVVRGSEKELKKKPLALFTCCPITPLKWSRLTAQDLVDCARCGIPVELVPVPMSGFISPVTLVGTLVAHTAENLSGLVIHQSAAAGAPLLYGAAPAPFDVRFETAPMGAVEAQMMCCAANEIGKYLGMPTQAFTALSDAKSLDAQAGLESAAGAVLAVLSGINSIAGPGALDFVNTFSIEKLVLDNELCAMMLRLVKGITPKEDFPGLPIFQELLEEKHLLIAEHSRRYLKEEHHWPGSVIDRANRQRWQAQGSLTLDERALQEVERLVSESPPSSLPEEKQKQLTEIMQAEAKRFGMDRLPKKG